MNALRKQCLQHVLLNTARTHAVLSIPVGVLPRFGEQSFAGRIPAHQALSECARGFMLHAHLYCDASRERQLRFDRSPSRVTYFTPLTLKAEREKEIPEHPA